jgi:hypothetical protein
MGGQIVSLYCCAFESCSAFCFVAELEAVVKRPGMEPLDGAVVAWDVDVTGRVLEVWGRECEAVDTMSESFSGDEEAELGSDWLVKFWEGFLGGWAQALRCPSSSESRRYFVGGDMLRANAWICE